MKGGSRGGGSPRSSLHSEIESKNRGVLVKTIDSYILDPF